MPEDESGEMRGAEHRRVQSQVCSCFPDRWSPRAFTGEPLRRWQVDALLEAARWAPSCYNEQPWSFYYALTAEARERLVRLLAPGNREWAAGASMLAVVAVRRSFKRGGKRNHYSSFDAGAAWMSLALQARKLGLYAHAMAGFDHDAAYGELGLSRQELRIIAAIAVGRRGDSEGLPPSLRKSESPSGRKPLEDVGVELEPRFRG